MPKEEGLAIQEARPSLLVKTSDFFSVLPLTLVCVRDSHKAHRLASFQNHRKEEDTRKQNVKLPCKVNTHLVLVHEQISRSATAARVVISTD